MKYRNKFPNELEFEPVQLCNAKCFTCPYTQLSKDSEYTSKNMSRENIKKLLISFLEMNKKYNKNRRALITPFRYSDPLICNELDVIFEIAEKYNALVQITTNAKGFNNKNIQILSKYHKNIKSISISIIGDTEDNVKKYMGPVSLNKTIESLKSLENENIKQKVEVSLRIVSGEDNEMRNLKILQKGFFDLNYKCKIKANWIANRNEQNITKISKKESLNYVVGCNLYDDKILKRLEVMVNGDVVLCCDDSVGQVVFGNVFIDSLEEIWNGKLLEYTKLIYSKNYTQEKNNLICSTCSRAVFNDDENKITFKDKIKYMKKRFSNQFIKIKE